MSQKSDNLALYTSMVVSFVMHEITGLLIKMLNLLISIGKYNENVAKSVIKKAVLQSLTYFEEHGDAYPEGLGRETRGVELFLEQIIAPLNEAASTKSE